MIDTEYLQHGKDLLKECSDCFWYFAQLCIAMDTSFEEIMQINYEKLSARYLKSARLR